MVALVVEHVVEGLIVRRHRQRLAELPPPSGGTAASHGTDREEVDVITLPGTTIDPETLGAIQEEMRTSGADVVDLVAGDLSIERTYGLLRFRDPARVAEDPLYAPGGAHEAVAVRRAVAARMGLAGGTTLDRGALVRSTIRAQRYAPTSTVVRIAPKLRAAPSPASDRWRELEEEMAFTEPAFTLAPVFLAVDLGHAVILAAGLAVAPWLGFVALATWSAQPAVALSGAPGGRGPAGEAQRAGPEWTDLAKATVLRFPSFVVDRLATAAVAIRMSWARAREQASDAGERPAPPRDSELFEQRRIACPWCGSESLVARLDTTDLFQNKPGRFHLDECRDCGHIFQNPALSLQGLDYYYDQFYDGASEALAEASFAHMSVLYDSRIEAVARVTEPQAWLDVGTGHGHFCLAARQRWPEARFDGLDLSESVEEAARRGWVDSSYRGLFPELADGLPRSYDVVSMHHYLEHTREPRRELAAAAKVLEPGGHLMIEVPDTASPWSRRLGRYWQCWFQPQHQHFVTCENMIDALHEAGFEVVSVERGPATCGGDLSLAVLRVLQSRAPSPKAPWLPRPTVRQRATRLGLIAMAAPIFGVLLTIDMVLDNQARRPGNTKPGNAFRIVARRS